MKDKIKNDLSIDVPINNGTGSVNLFNGDYNTSANIAGYDNSSLSPASIKVTAGVTVYDFTIESTGSLTLHVTENGTLSGVPVVGAKFVRCDKNGVPYGYPIFSNSNGDAVFRNVPYDALNPPKIYYKQKKSDGVHTFDDTLKETTMTEQNKTIKVTNLPAPARTFSVTDANYSGLPVEAGTITVKD